ncbi:MAG: hypothetical protein GY866_23265 [Proteobacteria bacterium]|nr:hypothetical protein [Pseudomonadota bacterium]
MSININFTEEDWQRVEGDWTAWWAGETDRPMVIVESINILMFNALNLSKEFLFEKPIGEVLDFFQEKLETVRYYGDAWPNWMPYFGPGIVAGFLGAGVEVIKEQSTVWFDAETRPPIQELRFEFDPNNAWWNRVKDFTRTAIERWGGQVAIGHTDLGGNLDILSSFRSANGLLMELYDAPEEVDRLVGEITEVWLRCYRELYDIVEPAGRGTCGWAGIWSPKGRTYMSQSDFCYMISPKMFERFVMPDLAALFESMDHGFYHLDGKGQIAHLDLLLSLEKLVGIQWIPGAGQPSPDEWLPLLKRIRDGGKLCQVYVSAEGARKIVREIGGKGFALYVTSGAAMSKEEIADFLEVLAKEDIGRA